MTLNLKAVLQKQEAILMNTTHEFQPFVFYLSSNSSVPIEALYHHTIYNIYKPHFHSIGTFFTEQLLNRQIAKHVEL